MSDFYEVSSNACECDVCQGANPNSVTPPDGWITYRTGGKCPAVIAYDPSKVWFKANTHGNEEDLSPEELDAVCGKIVDSPNGCHSERTYTTWVMRIK